MSRDLGIPISTGRTSEIYDWDQAHILTLFYNWVELEAIENEARITRAVEKTALCVPEVSEVVPRSFLQIALRVTLRLGRRPLPSLRMA